MGLHRHLWQKRGINPRAFSYFAAPGGAWTVDGKGLEDVTNAAAPLALGLADSGTGLTVTYDNAGDGAKGRVVDTGKAWAVNQWVGYGFRSGAAPGLNAEIVSNTATALTISVAWRTVPTAQTAYEIHAMGGNWWRDSSRPCPLYENGLASAAPYGN